jgi:hypothetical protein
MAGKLTTCWVAWDCHCAWVGIKVLQLIILLIVKGLTYCCIR